MSEFSSFLFAGVIAYIAYRNVNKIRIRKLGVNTHNVSPTHLRYHVIPDGKIFSRVLKDDLTAETLLEGENLRFNLNDNAGPTVNGVEIDKADERASNGVVHFIKEVIYPVPAGKQSKTMPAALVSFS